MVKEIMRDPVFLGVSSKEATQEDMQTVTDLLDTLKANSDRCVGMAANMIGVRKTILAALIGGKYRVMINPQIIGHSADFTEEEEGCLSLTGTRKAKRYRMITVEYLDTEFKKKRSTFRGFDAQIVQHEMDHFRGVLI